MNACVKKLVLTGALATMLSTPVLAAEGAGTLKDLTSVIALLGLPCGQVVNAERRADNDYLAVCSDSNRYRVYQTPEGRVTAQKL